MNPPKILYISVYYGCLFLCVYNVYMFVCIYVCVQLCKQNMPGLFDIRRVTILVFHDNFLLPINVVLTTFSYRYKASLRQGRATSIPETLLYSACDLTTNECISITNDMSAGAHSWLAHRVSVYRGWGRCYIEAQFLGSPDCAGPFM